MDPINVVQPQLNDNEYNAVMEVLKSGHLAEGEKSRTLEEKFSEYVGVKHAIFTSNGTMALHLALEALEIKPGSEILTTAFTFIASSNSILFIGAIPKFVDIDPLSFNIDPKKIEESISPNTKAIMPVHIFGLPSDMIEIKEIAEKHDLLIIEDSAQAHGGKINGKHVGSFGDVGCFSFYATKNMISGEGGMVVTDSDAIAEKCRSIKNHGRSADSFGGYAHFRVGYNFRGSDFAAAIAIEQLKKLPSFLEKRSFNFNKYTSEFRDLELQFQVYPDNFTHGNYICAPYLKDNKTNPSEVIKKLKEKGINSRTIYNSPTYTQPAYKNIKNWRWAIAGIKYPNYSEISLPVTENIAKSHFEIPCHPGLTEKQLNHVIKSLKDILSEK
ncbi:MAG: UDP-4-amino-4-deoxy-L-arabinose--oxoglutarate aminotransferase [Candidatus Heimdallarchaeota archaeon LC_3]|nr:MAG: UDP-4-amino-4-deoxy-L-arabinose--oxoglutarate aminotransferase [Candidatus Heimdallarchaeota archaeon LC_3]